MHQSLHSSPAARTARRRHLVPACLLAVTVLFGAACTSSLKGDKEAAKGAKKEQSGGTGTLTAWPATKAVAETSSPAFPDISVEVHPVLREPNGTATLFADVVNASSEDVNMSDLFTEGNLQAASLFDNPSRSRFTAIAEKTGNNCLCSANLRIEAGQTVSVHVRFGGVTAQVSKVRVALPGVRPVDSVPITQIGQFKAGPTASASVEEHPDLKVQVLGVWRTKDGTLVRVEQRNDGPDVVYPNDFGDLSDTTVADTDLSEASYVRSSSYSAIVSKTNLDRFARDDKVTRDVLVAPIAPSADQVIVDIPDVAPIPPIAVSSGAPKTTLTYTALDQPKSAALEAPVRHYPSSTVPLSPPEEVSIDSTGPELVKSGSGAPRVADSLTSTAQPGWTFAPRAVVQISSEQVMLIADLRNTGADETWPKGLGETSSDLDQIALIDPAHKQRLGALIGQDGDIGSRWTPGIDSGETRMVHLAFPAPAAGTKSLTVDVPTFGRAADVPVIAAPNASSGQAKATMRVDSNPRLRMDVLAISRLQGSNGTLVRARLVNESNADAVTPSFAGEGSHDLCDLTLIDPDTNRRFQVLDPCQSTRWSRAIGSGEGLVYEVRMPNLPADVARVDVDAPGWMSSAPVSVERNVNPSYLDLPKVSDAPEGDSPIGSVGVADDLQTEVRSGEKVDLRLNTDVLFPFGSADLTPEAASHLRAIATRLATVASGTVEVTGYTDSIGDDASNLSLSTRRAEAVKAALAQGSSLTFSVEGRGESDPLAPERIDGRDNPDGRARNRRVTVSYTAR